MADDQNSNSEKMGERPSDRPEASSQSDLGHAIYARYGTLQNVAASSWPLLSRFMADRVPLLSTIQRRWGLSESPRPLDFEYLWRAGQTVWQKPVAAPSGRGAMLQKKESTGDSPGHEAATTFIGLTPTAGALHSGTSDRAAPDYGVSGRTLPKDVVVTGSPSAGATELAGVECASATGIAPAKTEIQKSFTVLQRPILARNVGRSSLVQRNSSPSPAMQQGAPRILAGLPVPAQPVFPSSDKEPAHDIATAREPQTEYRSSAEVSQPQLNKPDAESLKNSSSTFSPTPGSADAGQRAERNEAAPILQKGVPPAEDGIRASRWQPGAFVLHQAGAVQMEQRGSAGQPAVQRQSSPSAPTVNQPPISPPGNSLKEASPMVHPVDSAAARRLLSRKLQGEPVGVGPLLRPDTLITQKMEKPAAAVVHPIVPALYRMPSSSGVSQALPATAAATEANGIREVNPAVANNHVAGDTDVGSTARSFSFADERPPISAEAFQASMKQTPEISGVPTVLPLLYRVADIHRTSEKANESALPSVGALESMAAAPLQALARTEPMLSEMPKAEVDLGKREPVPFVELPSTSHARSFQIQRRPMLTNRIQTRRHGVDGVENASVAQQFAAEAGSITPWIAPGTAGAVWRSTPEAVIAPSQPATATLYMEHHLRSSATNQIQRSPAPMPGGAGAGSPISVPMADAAAPATYAPNAAARADLKSQRDMDLNQLANSVYNLLVRRLSGERQRRGL